MSIAWNQEQAIFFCSLVEQFAPKYGCHVALTGGCLYKSHDRKDLDIVLYRIRQAEVIDFDGLLAELNTKLGVRLVKRLSGWLTKLEWADRKIDVFFPEEGNNTSDESSEYPDDD